MQIHFFTYNLLLTKNPISGHLSILTVNIIFGLTVPFMKVLSNGWLDPVSLLAVRAFFAMLIFWLISCFVRKEKVTGRELWTILIGAQLGFVLSQYFTVLSLNYTSAVYTAIALACTPVISLLLGAVFQHERITLTKLVGVVLALGGALLMILKGQSATTGANDVLGICLAFLGGLSIAIYYIIMGGISERYSATTQMKWTFLFSGIALFPIGLYQFPTQAMYVGSPSVSVIGVLIFVILFSTVLAFFLLPFGMKSLPATTVSIYMNLQPVVAATAAIFMKQDHFSLDKPISALLVILGAYLVTKAPKGVSK